MTALWSMRLLCWLCTACPRREAQVLGSLSAGSRCFSSTGPWGTSWTSLWSAATATDSSWSKVPNCLYSFSQSLCCVSHNRPESLKLTCSIVKPLNIKKKKKQKRGIWEMHLSDWEILWSNTCNPRITFGKLENQYYSFSLRWNYEGTHFPKASSESQKPTVTIEITWSYWVKVWKPETKVEVPLPPVDEHEDDPNFLSKTILRHLEQQSKEEVCLNGAPQQETNKPVEVEDWHNSEPMSREPTLMISLDRPQPLRGPVEDTDSFRAT